MKVLLTIWIIPVAALTAMAQTQVDLRTQAKKVDFSAATSTKPFRTGTALPATCTVGEFYFKSNATAGNNTFACTAANQWSPQAGASSLNVQNDGLSVGAATTANFVSGPGFMSVVSDSGTRISIQSAADTAVLQTRFGEQTGSGLLCESSGYASGKYQCAMNPTLASFTRGMVLHWIPDADSPGGPISLNVDTLGALPVKAADGLRDPAAGEIAAGRMQTIWQDGALFRLALPANVLASGGAAAGLADPGTNGIVYRNGAGSSVAATADDLSRPLACVDTGAGNAYGCNLAPAITTYTPGTSYWFKAGSANTGAATLSLNSLPSKPIRKNVDRELDAGDIKAGQWLMLTYDGTNMQMQVPVANTPAAGVTSIFGRSGAVSAQGGDYTTAQVPESGNLYFTAARALGAVTWNTMTGIPSSFPPAGHAATHRDGGADEIGSAAPAGHSIPKAGPNGKLAQGWIDFTGYQPSTGEFAGNAATTTALRNVPAKCSPGSYPLGIDAAGNAANCTPASGASAGPEISVTGSTISRNPFDFGQLLGKDDFCGYSPATLTNSTTVASRLSWSATSASGAFGSGGGITAASPCGVVLSSQAAQKVALSAAALRINAASHSNWKLYGIASISSIGTSTFQFGIGASTCNNCVVVSGAPGTTNLLLQSCNAYTCSTADTGVPYAAETVYKMYIREGVAGTIYASVNGSPEVSVNSNMSNSLQPVFFSATPTSGTTAMTVSGFAYQLAGY
jgi:hypothetical protein